MAEQLLGRARRHEGLLHARRLDGAAVQDLEPQSLGDVDDARRRQTRLGDHRRQHRDGFRLALDDQRSGLGERRRGRRRAMVEQNAGDRPAPFVAVLFDRRGGSDGEIAQIAVARREDGNDVGAERLDHLDVEARGDLDVDFGNETFDDDDVAGRAHALDNRDDLFHQPGQLSGADHLRGMIESNRLRRDLAAQGAGEVDGEVAVALHRLGLEDRLEEADPHAGQSQGPHESQRHRREPDLLGNRDQIDGVTGGRHVHRKCPAKSVEALGRPAEPGYAGSGGYGDGWLGSHDRDDGQGVVFAAAKPIGPNADAPH